MKIALLKIVVAVSVVLVSSVVVAGGANCDSKKGHSKELSVELKEQFKSDHAWLFADEEVKTSEPARSNKPDDTKKSNASDLVEI